MLVNNISKGHLEISVKGKNRTTFSTGVSVVQTPLYKNPWLFPIYLISIIIKVKFIKLSNVC